MAQHPPALFTATWGPSPPRVVAIHGLGASCLYWATLAGAIGDTGLRGVDLLGFGRSPMPPDDPYDVESHLAALDPLIPAGTVLIAHSTGCILAAAFAVSRPDRVRGLVLTGCPAWPDETVAGREVRRLGALARWTAAGDRRAAWLCRFMCNHKVAAITLAPLATRSFPPDIAADAFRHSWPSYARTLSNVVVHHPIGADLARLSVPVRIVHATDDPTTGISYVRTLVDDAKRVGRDVALTEVPTGGHHIALRHADALATALHGLLC